MSDEQPTNKLKGKADHLQPYQFKKGQSGNPGGRPPGPSLKEYAKSMLANMTEEERQDFLHGLPKEVIWKMAEANPATSTDITSKGEAISFNVVKYGDNQSIVPTETLPNTAS